MRKLRKVVKKEKSLGRLFKNPFAGKDNSVHTQNVGR